MLTSPVGSLYSTLTLHAAHHQLPEVALTKTIFNALTGKSHSQLQRTGTIATVRRWFLARKDKEMETKVVVLFDFDHTVIDKNSDVWVPVQMGLIHLFRQLHGSMPWNPLMNRMMMEIHSQGKTVGDIADCLKQIPIHPRIIESIKTAHSFGCDLKIISDANQFFIETILKHHGLLGCFSEIVTNATFVDEEGRLNIVPFHDFTSSSHGCELCPPHMCKGIAIKRIQADCSADVKRKYIYLGDGKGDYCPILKLGSEDFAMPRKGYPLLECMNSDQTLIKAEVLEWSDGEELAGVLLTVINDIRGE